MFVDARATGACKQSLVSGFYKGAPSCAGTAVTCPMHPLHRPPRRYFIAGVAGAVDPIVCHRQSEMKCKLRTKHALPEGPSAEMQWRTRQSCTSWYSWRKLDSASLALSSNVKDIFVIGFQVFERKALNQGGLQENAGALRTANWLIECEHEPYECMYGLKLLEERVNES